MATLKNYCQIVREVLAEHATNNDKNIESQVIYDTENDHYLLVDIGWQGNDRIYASYVHIDIKDGKIWIQQNMTEIDLGQELVAKGVPPSDIILGLHPPYKRPYTNYGVA
ncbi:MAG: XisI protein [Rhizonema sp. PD38]|nr:XisI protein [Rhizonema sp. PD38]